MGKRRNVIGVIAFGAMLIIILDGNTAVKGAYDGVMLCIKTVIPSLFPFFVLSMLITGSLMGTSIKWLRPIGKCMEIPQGMESILIPAFLGGYPVAAQTIAHAYHQGQVPKIEAERLLGFCNNAGPSFLFGMAASLFPHMGMAWMLWAIQICSAVVTAKLFPSAKGTSGSLPVSPISLPKILKNAMQAMALVCGWIVIFRVIIEFLKQWILWVLPVTGQAAVVGMLELANGCIDLAAVDDIRLRFVFCSGLLTFGGICVVMQIASAANGLSLKRFFQGKWVQTVISILFSCGVAYNKPLLILIPGMVFLVKMRKNGSIPVETGV